MTHLICNSRDELPRGRAQSESAAGCPLWEPNVKKVALLRDWNEDCRTMEKYIRERAVTRSPLHILEAGCGQFWPLDLSGVEYSLTGIDTDSDALELRRTRYNDLDETIVGDLRAVDIGKNRYDVIYNSYVLEHIDGAASVLEKFASGLKPGGILILRIPDRDSVRGFITRATPHWFHVWYNRHIVGFKEAGTAGFGPYPTFYDRIVSRAGIQEFCRRAHFIVKEEYGHGCGFGEGVMGYLTHLFARTVSHLSFGKLAWEHSDLTYILEKR